MSIVFFLQAEDGIRDAQESRGLGDVYKRQLLGGFKGLSGSDLGGLAIKGALEKAGVTGEQVDYCLLYTSDAADELLCVDLGGRRIIKKKNHSYRSLTTRVLHFIQSIITPITLHFSHL